MPMKFSKINQRDHLLISLLLLLILLLDWQTPLGYAVWICYLTPLILAGRSSSPRIVRMVAAAGSGLIVLGYFLSPPGTAPLAMVICNRALGIAVIWWTVTLLTGSTQEDQRIRTTFEAIPSGLLVANRMGRIVLVNAGLERMFGYSEDELIGELVERLIPERYRGAHPSQRAGFSHSPSARPMGSGRDLYGLRKDGTEFPVEIGLNPIPGATGMQVLASIVDITERRKVEQRQAFRLNQLKALSAWSLTLSGDLNDVFEQSVRVLGEMFGVSVVCLSEIVGEELHFKSVFVKGQVFREAGRCSLSITPCATVHTAKDLRVYDRVMERFPEASFLREHHAVAYCGMPSLDSQGRVVAVTCLLDDQPRDFTEEDQELLRIFGQRLAAEIERARHLVLRNEADAALRESETRLNEAQRIAQVGSWELTLDTSALTWSEQIFRIFEIDPVQFEASYEAFLDRVHPDDRDLVNATYRSSLETRQPYEIVHRLLMADGRIKYVQERGETEYRPDGTPLRSAGTVQDITDRRRAEEELRRSEAFVSSVLDNLPNMVFVKDAEELRFVRLNKAGEALLGYSHDELLGKSGYDFFPKEEADFFVAADRKVLAERRLLDIPEEPVHTKQQGTRYLHTKKIPIYNADGRPQYLLGISEDITERKQVEERLRQEEVIRRVFEEREAVSRNLHDGILQSLYAIRLGLEHCRRLLIRSSQPALPEMDARIEDVGLVIAEVRDFMTGQDPPWARTLDLRAGVEEILQLHRVGERPILGLHMAGQDCPVGVSREEVKHVLYIVREAVSNAIRHASAGFCDVTIASIEDRLRVTVEDDGTGFVRRAEGNGRGFGNMEARARQIGASIDIASAPGRGTIITIELARRDIHVTA